MFLLPYSALLESKRHLCFSINDTNKILKSGSSLMVAWHVMWRWQKYEWLYVDAVQVTSNTHVTLRRSLSARFASDRGPARRGSLYVTAGKTCTTYTPIEKHLPPVSGLQAEARWERIDEIYYLSQIYAALLSNPPGAAPSTTRIFFSAQRFNLNNYNSSASIVIIIIIIIIIITIIIIIQVPRTGEWNMWHVEAKGSTSDPDSNTIYGSHSKVTITKSTNT